MGWRSWQVTQPVALNKTGVEMAQDILPQSPPSSNQQFEPFTASDDAIIVWMTERARLREQEDREAYERWCDEQEQAIFDREREQMEREGNAPQVEHECNLCGLPVVGSENHQECEDYENHAWEVPDDVYAEWMEGKDFGRED